MFPTWEKEICQGVQYGRVVVVRTQFHGYMSLHPSPYTPERIVVWIQSNASIQQIVGFPEEGH